jgi:hypothetical protein
VVVQPPAEEVSMVAGITLGLLTLVALLVSAFDDPTD